MLKRADLHLHTRFSEWKHLRIIKPSDSYNEPLDVYRRCKQIGMDFVAITDHDTIDGALDLLAKHPELEPEIIVGEEVETCFPDTGQWIHVNVFDVDEATHRDLQRLSGNVYELVAYLRGRGLYHVLNHPFQTYRLQKPALAYISEILALFDHFEVGNGTLSSRHNAAVAEMLEYAAALCIPKHGVGGSDAHNLCHIGFYWTEAEVPDGAGGKREWLAALARGEARAVGRTIGVTGLLANVYRIVGRYYLSLRDPDVRKHMGARNYLAAAILVPGCLVGVPAFLSLGNSLRVEVVCRHLRRALRQADRAVMRDPIAPPSPELLEDPQD